MPVPVCAGVTIGGIIYDICQRCGIDQVYVDPSLLQVSPDHIVDGYAIGRATTGRAILQPLALHTPFDVAETQFNWEGHLFVPQLIFFPRGGAIVAELTEDDLGAHPSGESVRPSVEITRQQEIEIPKRVRLHYAQTDQNYEVGQQSSNRVSVATRLESDIEAPFAMTELKAAKAAEVLLYEAWVARNQYRISVSSRWMNLLPGDPITIPVDGRQQRVRVTRTDHALPTLLHISCVADDDGSYQSYALGTETAYGGPAEMELDNAGTPSFVVLDIPLLRSDDVNSAGYYVAACAVGATFFRAAAVYRAVDLVTFAEVASTELAATMGTLDADLPAGPTTIFDDGNEIIVTLDNGELESFPESTILLGANAAAIGADGRWEIVQFRDAELVVSSPQTNTWRLTGLLRGRRGTEWAVGTGVTGDAFVLLDDALMFIPLDFSRIGGEVAHKVLLQGGGTLEDATAENFTPQGVALEPFSPVNLIVTEDGGDLDLEWTRRSRVGTELVSGIELPLLESDERYEIDIESAAAPGVVVRTIQVTAPTATYTAADQTTDFGGPAPPLVMRVYQMSATVGRGYPLEGTYP